MYDGSFQILEEVVDFYSDGVNQSHNIDSKMGIVYDNGAKLTPTQKRQVIAFLKTLTDSVFIYDK